MLQVQVGAVAPPLAEAAGTLLAPEEGSASLVGSEGPVASHEPSSLRIYHALRTSAARSTSRGQTSNSGHSEQSGTPGRHQRRPMSHIGKSIAPGRVGFRRRPASIMWSRSSRSARPVRRKTRRMFSMREISRIYPRKILIRTRPSTKFSNACGARGRWDGEEFLLKQKRKIRYMPLILKSNDYKNSLEEYNKTKQTNK